MLKHAAFIIFVVATGLVGCVSNYLYRAEGEVFTASGQKRGAVIFWYKDEGRLWYGRKFEQTETTLNLRICQELPKAFELADDGHIELKSKSGDIRVARVDATGEFVRLKQSEVLHEGGRCGLILAEGNPVSTKQLLEGVRPIVSILCKNESILNRYPVASNYPFNPVSREISSDDRKGPDPCLSIQRSN